MPDGIVIVFDNCCEDDTGRRRTLERRSRHKFRIIELVVADADLRLHDASLAGIRRSQRAERGRSSIAFLVENHVLNEVRLVQILELQLVNGPFQFIDHGPHDRMGRNTSSLAVDGRRRVQLYSTYDAFLYMSWVD